MNWNCPRCGFENFEAGYFCRGCKKDIYTGKGIKALLCVSLGLGVLPFFLWYCFFALTMLFGIPFGLWPRVLSILCTIVIAIVCAEKMVDWDTLKKVEVWW